jgi:O-antigen ligase
MGLKQYKRTCLGLIIFFFLSCAPFLNFFFLTKSQKQKAMVKQKLFKRKASFCFFFLFFILVHFFSVPFKQ